MARAHGDYAPPCVLLGDGLLDHTAFFIFPTSSVRAQRAFHAVSRYALRSVARFAVLHPHRDGLAGSSIP